MCSRDHDAGTWTAIVKSAAISSGTFLQHRRFATGATRSRLAMRAAAVRGVAPAWRRASQQEIDGANALAFDQVCVVDAKQLLGKTQWNNFEAFAGSELGDSISALVATEDGPIIFVRRVDAGEHEWPILQEGRN